MMLALAVALLAPAEPWLVQVKPGARRYFHQSENGGAFSRAAAYVVPGDQLVADDVRGGFTSVTYVAADGRARSGWIESTALTRVAPRSVWRGSWKGWNGEVEAKPGRRGMLHVEGSATWGGHNPERVQRGGVNIGDFAIDIAIPRGDRIAFSLADAGGTAARPYGENPADEFRCRIKLRVLGPYLLAEDNRQCGGHNVTFTGTYRLRPKG
jgi:hypothetical protein